MCLSNLTTKRPKIAKEDIICYKELYFNKHLRTTYQNFLIEIGKTYRSLLIVENNVINIGIHSYENLNSANSLRAKCIIPKGTKYYKGTFCGYKCYASNTIKYIELCKY